jgi:general secretion pathway protein D
MRLRIKTLVAHLDTPVDTGSETQVRYLRYSDAEDLAGRLKQQLTGTTGASSTMNRLLERGQPTPQAQPNAQGTTPRPTAETGASPAGGSGAAATVSLAGGTATIWADKDTNSLIITAGQRTMRAVNAIIDKLDIRRPQVIVQAIICEVSVDKTSDLGVNWLVDASAKSLGVGGFIAPVNGSSAVNLYEDITSPSSITSSPPSGTILGIGKLSASGVNFAAVLQALQSDSRTNILATPQVVTRDNQEAKMEVAQEVPFLTGQYSTTNGTGSAFQTIQREEVGTILTVTPTINEGDAVLLKLQIESSSLSGSSEGAVDLVTNKNVITTSVLIKNGGTLVLGGLIQDSVTNSNNSVPLLGSIPLLGELFRARNTQKTKTDFLIFLQPRILRTDAEAAIETDAKYDYMRQEQRTSARDHTKLPLQPFQPIDMLPPIRNGETPLGVLSPDTVDEGAAGNNPRNGGAARGKPAASMPLAPSTIGGAPATAPASATSSAPGANVPADATPATAAKPDTTSGTPASGTPASGGTP